MSLKDGNICEALLPELPDEKQKHFNSFKGSYLKLNRKVRRCHSAPTFDASNPIKRPTGRVLKPISDYSNSRYTLARAAFVLAIYLGIGMICFFTIQSELDGDRTNCLVDALYFSVVTLTTVGYGDLYPAGIIARLFTCAFVFVGFGIVGLLLGSAADFILEQQESLLLKAFYKRESPELDEFSESFHTNKIRWKVAIAGALVLALFGIGVLFLIKVEGMNVLNAFYCVCVTVTTLGYGDVSFHTLGGRIFAVIWILVSTICVAQFFLYIAELWTEGRRQALVNWVLSRKTTCSDLEAADMDDDGIVSAAEFIIFKLKEMGKIQEEDIVPILKEFEELDVDESGTLTKSDLNVLQTIAEE